MTVTVCHFAGVIADLHGSKNSQGGGCGGVRARAVEQVVAAEWALNTINNQSQQDYTIGRYCSGININMP